MDVNRYIAENIYCESEPRDNNVIANSQKMGGVMIPYSVGVHPSGLWIKILKNDVESWGPVRFDEDYYLASDAVIKAASPDHEEYSIILERTTHAYYAFYSEDEIYYRPEEHIHGFPVSYSSSANGPSQALANLAVEIHKQRNG